MKNHKNIKKENMCLKGIVFKKYLQNEKLLSIISILIIFVFFDALYKKK